MAIDWKPEYSVNVKKIDTQHKKLISTINRLYQAIYTYKTREELKPILEELIKYSKYHFATEEKYFDKFKYENSQEHKKEHKKFEEKILGLYGKFKNKEAEISFELIDFLEDWLLDHVIRQDQKYVKCFKEHGLS